MSAPARASKGAPLSGVTPQAGELPHQPAALLGRETELAAAQALLERPDVRLLTVTGPGGSGKTRLAVEVAARMQRGFAGGACFVDLAPLAEPQLVLPAIARALGVRDAAGQTLAERVREHLFSRRTLLVLDNFEHLMPAAPDVAGLLVACPDLSVLATSRASLRIRWEHELAVPPLALPDLAHLGAPAAVARVPAVALFLQRAEAVRPDFQLMAGNLAAVAEICMRLDGLPLAIELAAGQIDVFPPQEILAALRRHGLDALAGGAADLPARQRTLRRTLDWSYDLLSTREQALLQRLAVFAGSFTFEAAEAVAGAGWTAGARGESQPAAATPAIGADTLAVRSGVAALVRKHLLSSVGPALAGDGAAPRFRMLETIRTYALERLERSGESRDVHDRHVAYFLALAEQSEREQMISVRPAWVARLEQEIDNLRAALHWSVERGDAEHGLRLGAALAPYWQARGRWHEGREALEAVLALPAGQDDPASPSPSAARGGAARGGPAGDLPERLPQGAYPLRAKPRRCRGAWRWAARGRCARRPGARRTNPGRPRPGAIPRRAGGGALSGGRLPA